MVIRLLDYRRDTINDYQQKTFIPEIYETFTQDPDVNSVNDILHVILRGSSYVNYNRIGKLLSLVLEKTQDLLMEVEKDKGSTSRI